MRVAVIMALAIVLAAPGSARAATHAGTTAFKTTHGLRITLRAGRRTYPRNAVVAVKLAIRNISRHAISIMAGQNSPQIVVLSERGGLGYDSYDPLGDLTLLVPTGPGPESYSLAPGAVWPISTYVVLGRGAVTARITLGDARNFSREVTITGPRLTLHLTAEPAPRVSLSTSPLSATLKSSVPASGPLVYYSQTRCDNSAGGSSEEGTGWVTTRRSVIRPEGEAGCTHFTWHAIVGRLNHPVATITYETGVSAAEQFRRAE